jgi:hypothetical protein
MVWLAVLFAALLGMLAPCAALSTSPENPSDSGWPRCVLELTALAPLLYPASASPKPVSGSELQYARARFAQSIADAWLVGFEDNEKESSVIFRSTEDPDSSHRPGPMEDELIASTVRGQIVADQELQKLKLAVVCRAGRIRMEGTPESAAQTASLIALALSIEGVSEVQVDLPAELRKPGLVGKTAE